MPGHDADLALLVDAARAAGAIALRYFKRDPQVWDKGDGAGPVTEADLAVNAMLVERLRTARPGYGWLSEETPDSADRLTAERVFIIDPIDGTRAFIDGQDSFAHSLAVVERGVVVAGAVFIPAKNRMYGATLDGPATCNGAVIAASAPGGVAGATVLTSKPNMADMHWPGGVPGVERAFRPSLAYRLCLVAEGRFDAMLAFRATWEWDIAAGALIAARAGAVASDGRGAALRFNAADPRTDGVVVAGPALHGALMALRG
ncbi:myo-inositol-1(or 4)-monophosphatase [Pseudorhodobacter antarcticus]|uniref:Myo-inositol-1(Or 4)-monophosphatase n=1 Tax=Pseudorhodobacter antarcticus TaxID=1077947 RepID=A0A1H8CC48_9RHOB|nr:3'(2'),5'-bisphosphate nucleotidase CysQ [Pseudorhodobacter antarcticus]SEM92004.1 myo-inositol-1(or 4)-monophosphatase [Pseudorhodobacter antarcticus]